MHVILTGFPRSGKTTLGHALARAYHCHLWDTDDWLKAHATSEGLPHAQNLAERYTHLGEQGFRQWEAQALETLPEPMPMVVALGGGVMTQPSLADRFRAMGMVIYLRCTPAQLQTRYEQTQWPRSLCPQWPQTPEAPTWEMLYQERDACYQATSHHCYEMPEGPVERCCKDLQTWIAQRIDSTTF